MERANYFYSILSCQLLHVTWLKHPTRSPFWLQALQCQSASRTHGDPRGQAPRTGSGTAPESSLPVKMSYITWQITTPLGPVWKKKGWNISSIQFAEEEVVSDLVFLLAQEDSVPGQVVLGVTLPAFCSGPWHMPLPTLYVDSLRCLQFYYSSNIIIRSTYKFHSTHVPPQETWRWWCSAPLPHISSSLRFFHFFKHIHCFSHETERIYEVWLTWLSCKLLFHTRWQLENEIHITGLKISA